MRISGGFFVAVLLAAGFALYLTGRDARTSFDAVNTAAEGLREEGVEGRSLDPDTASRMVAAMEGLLEFPETIADHREDLRAMAEIAASWAAAAAPASRENHIAVSLRSAVGDLRAYGLTPSDAHLTRARRHLDAARNTLEGGGETEPQLATDGLRDQLHNLEQAQREQQQQVDEALKR